MNELPPGLSIMKNTMDSKKNEKYESLLECILADQLSAQQIQEEFKADPQFEKYYKSQRGLMDTLNGEMGYILDKKNPI